MEKKDQQYFVHNFDEFNYIAVIVGKQHHEGNVKLPVNYCLPHLINAATLSCKMKCAAYWPVAARRQNGQSARRQFWLSNSPDLNPVDDSM